MYPRASTLFRPCSLFCLFFFFVSQAYCYEVPLSPAAIHEAYVLGQRNDAVTAQFRSPYMKQITERSQTGPSIAETEILTPFLQIVDESQHNTNGFTEQQATDRYHQRGDVVIVRALLMLPAAYPKPGAPPAAGASAPSNEALRPENFWQNFRFSVKQRGKVIPSRSMKNVPVYSSATPDAPAVLLGATVWLQYDAKDVASEDTFVEVVTPDSTTISTPFDLKKLR